MELFVPNQAILEKKKENDLYFRGENAGVGEIVYSFTG